MKNSLRTRAALALASLLGVCLGVSGIAHAQGLQDAFAERRHVGSPERFAFEVRVGPYTPDVGNSAFTDTFGDATGPLIAAELDYLPIRIPYVGLLGIGGSIGWVDYSAHAFGQDSSVRVGESTGLTLFPVSAVGVLRIDSLAHELHFPIVLTGKLGMDAVPWNATKGTATQASGTSFGLRWAVQAAFELDVFDYRAARQLDEEWGINHTWVWAEVYGSTAGGESLHVGDTTWAAGIGLTF